MATIKKRSNKRFTAEIRKNGQYYAKTFDTKVQALAWAVDMEQSLTHDGVISGKTLEDLFIRYRDEITINKKSCYNETNRINRLLKDPIVKGLLQEQKQTDFYDWIERMLAIKKSSSVNRDLNLFSAAYQQGTRWNWTNHNPIRGIQRPKNPPHRERRISENEIEHIINALGFDGYTVQSIRDIVAVAFLFALETAMRQGEIWSLNWQQVYLEKRYLKLYKTKNGTKRDVPLSTRAIELLMLLSTTRKGKVFKSNQNSSAQIFHRAVILAGIEGLTFHDARHEALTRLARKLDVLDLARMVGHRDPRSLMIYYNPTAEEMAQRLG